MRTLLLFAAVSSLLAGCASSSRNIAPSYVSTVGYQSLTCDQLEEEAAAVSSRAVVVSGQQDRQSGSDAAMVGITALVFWPAVFFVGGDGATASEVSRLKGEMQAIETVNRQKNCGIQFRR